MRASGLLVVALCALLATAALAQPAGGSYGPCCPLVKGQQALSTTAGTVTGPRYVCQTRSVTVNLNGEAKAVAALEVTGSLLVPARLFTAAGATLEWGGNRRLVLSAGARRVELQLGSHAITISDGAESEMVSWPLCPRLVNDLSYVPLRLMAGALGLSVTVTEGVINLATMEQCRPAVPLAPVQVKCPADRVDEALGVTSIRSPAPSSFGPGAGITRVALEGLGARFGLQAGDVIIGANDRPVKCPKDLDQILLQAAGQTGDLRTLTVARGQEKLTLSPGPAQ